jgi:hypothetical protein
VRASAPGAVRADFWMALGPATTVSRPRQKRIHSPPDWRRTWRQSKEANLGSPATSRTSPLHRIAEAPTRTAPGSSDLLVLRRAGRSCRWSCRGDGAVPVLVLRSPLLGRSGPTCTRGSVYFSGRVAQLWDTVCDASAAVVRTRKFFNLNVYRPLLGFHQPETCIIRVCAGIRSSRLPLMP